MDLLRTFPVTNFKNNVYCEKMTKTASAFHSFSGRPISLDISMAYTHSFRDIRLEMINLFMQLTNVELTP